MYHYTYYSYEPFGRGYIGSRSCKNPPEKDINYFGSYRDKAFNPTEKIILKEYSTREYALKDEILLHDFYQVHNNPHFANRAKQTSEKFILMGDKAVEVGRKFGRKAYEEGKGIHALTPEERREVAKKGGQKSYEEGKGAHALTPEEKIKFGRKGGIKGGQKAYEEGKGMFSLTPEERKEINKKINSQKWKCTVTGYVTNAGALSLYQKKRGIDTSNRIRIQ